MMNELGPEFGLAQSLHAFPHLNLSLQDIVHKNFNFSNEQYIQSLEVYCLSGVMLGIVLFITFGFIQCCLGCRRCGGYSISYRMKQYNPILTTFLFCCTLGAMVTAGVSLYYGVVRVQGDVNNMSAFINDISETIDEYDQLMDDIKQDVVSLKNSTKSLPNSHYIAVKLTDIAKEIDREKIPDLHDDLRELITYNRARELVTLGLLLLHLFCCATLLIGICYGRVFVLHCSLAMLILCIIFLSASVGIYLSGAMAAADICVEQKDFVTYIIDVEQVAEDVVKLFAKCHDTPGTSSDLKALTLLSSFIGFLNELGPAEKLLPAVQKTLDDITVETERFQHLMSCQQLNKDHKEIIDILCKPFLKNMCLYCLMTLISVFMVWTVINQLKPYADRVEEWLKVECILDKNITMTPDADETEHLITDTSYPPPYRPTYGTNTGYNSEEHDYLDHILSNDFDQPASFYQSVLSNASPLLSRLQKS